MSAFTDRLYAEWLWAHGGGRGSVLRPPPPGDRERGVRAPNGAQGAPAPGGRGAASPPPGSAIGAARSALWGGAAQHFAIKE